MKAPLQVLELDSKSFVFLVNSSEYLKRPFGTDLSEHPDSWR
jgi:hypothetical protein